MIGKASPRLVFKKLDVMFMNHGKYMMRRLNRSIFLVVLKEREITHPKELVSFLAQAESFAQKQPYFTEFLENLVFVSGFD